MYPSIFFSNNYQLNFDEYLIVKEFNLNFLYSNSSASILTLQLPTTAFESELLVPSPYTYTQEDTYFEDNLSAAREDAFYQGINDIDQKYFYRILDNDLATLNARGLYEYTLPTSYILITYTVNNILHELFLPLPLKELIYNYYVGGQLSLCPLNISFGYESNLISQEILKPDYTLVTEVIPLDYYTAAVNSLFTELIIEGLPSTNINIKLFISNTLQTFTKTDNALIFYPKSKYSLDTISIKDLAWGLYSIKNFRPLDYPVLINSVINGLTYQIQDLEYYLPVLIQFDEDGIESYSDTFDKYSYYDNTLLVLSLLFNISHAYSTSYQKYLDNVLEKLISSFNLFSGYCNKEISTNLVPIVINDIPTTIVLALVLEKYLGFKYNPLYEYILYKINKQLEQIVIDLEVRNNYLTELESIDDQLDLLLHVALWVESRDQTVYIMTAQDYTNFRLDLADLIEETDPALVSVESIFKINYLINLLNLTLEPATLSNWDYSNFVTEYYPRVWGDDEPSLVYSSWVNIIEQQLPIWVSSSYQLKTVQSETFLANIFQRSLKYLPINDPWFNPDNLDPNVGLIGLIMKAVSNLYLPLIFEYLCLFSSLNIDNAYGFGLDKWGLFLDYPRELNEDDDSYRHKLKQFLTINFINSTNLETFINNIKQVSATTLESELPTTILYKNESYTVLDVQDLYLKASENNPPSVMLTTGEQFELAKELGVLKITSYETEEYNKVFFKLKELFGVPVILKTIRSFELLDSNTIIYPN